LIFKILNYLLWRIRNIYFFQNFTWEIAISEKLFFLVFLYLKNVISNVLEDFKITYCEYTCNEFISFRIDFQNWVIRSEKSWRILIHGTNIFFQNTSEMCILEIFNTFWIILSENVIILRDNLCDFTLMQNCVRRNYGSEKLSFVWSKHMNWAFHETHVDWAPQKMMIELIANNVQNNYRMKHVMKYWMNIVCLVI